MTLCRYVTILTKKTTSRRLPSRVEQKLQIFSYTKHEKQVLKSVLAFRLVPSNDSPVLPKCKPLELFLIPGRCRCISLDSSVPFSQWFSWPEWPPLYLPPFLSLPFLFLFSSSVVTDSNCPLGYARPFRVLSIDTSFTNPFNRRQSRTCIFHILRSTSDSDSPCLSPINFIAIASQKTRDAVSFHNLPQEPVEINAYFFDSGRIGLADTSFHETLNLWYLYHIGAYNLLPWEKS